jgi:hypothetical protein
MRAFSKPEEEESSESDDSSDNSISSTERDELVRKYFRKILCPILKEERDESRKETLDILQEKGLLELAERRNELIQFSSAQRYDPNDPFLEDEGFAPSDVSGATTPKKTPYSNVSNMSVDSSKREGQPSLNVNGGNNNFIDTKKGFIQSGAISGVKPTEKGFI